MATDAQHLEAIHLFTEWEYRAACDFARRCQGKTNAQWLFDRPPGTVQLVSVYCVRSGFCRARLRCFEREPALVIIDDHESGNVERSREPRFGRGDLSILSTWVVDRC